jgi:hypothetical protein
MQSIPWKSSPLKQVKSQRDNRSPDSSPGIAHLCRHPLEIPTIQRDDALLEFLTILERLTFGYPGDGLPEKKALSSSGSSRRAIVGTLSAATVSPQSIRAHLLHRFDF